DLGAEEVPAPAHGERGGDGEEQPGERDAGGDGGPRRPSGVEQRLGEGAGGGEAGRRGQAEGDAATGSAGGWSRSGHGRVTLSAAHPISAPYRRDLASRGRR